MKNTTRKLLILFLLSISFSSIGQKIPRKILLKDIYNNTTWETPLFNNDINEFNTVIDGRYSPKQIINDSLANIRNSITTKANINNPNFTGQIGINTITPYSRLQINNYGQVNGLTLGNRPDVNLAVSTSIYTDNTENGVFNLQTVKAGVGFGTTSIQPDGGQVGIGTRNPTAKLEVNGDIKFGSGTNLQTALDLKPNSASPSFTGVFTSTSTKHLFGSQTDDGTANQFSGNVIAKSNLFVTGNSSFGTTNQYGLLTVQKDQNANTTIFLTNRGSGTSQKAAYYVDNGAYGFAMEVLGGSYTTSASALANRSRLIANSSTGLAIVSQNNSLSFWTNNPETEKMTILTGGNVGIGTTSPTSKLQVVGLPTYADNTTALAGGLTAGAFYRTSTGVLMVVF